MPTVLWITSMICVCPRNEKSWMELTSAELELRGVKYRGFQITWKNSTVKCESIKCKWAKNQIILEFQVPRLHKHSKHKLCYIPSHRSSSKSCSYIMTSSPGCLAVPTCISTKYDSVNSLKLWNQAFFFFWLMVILWGIFHQKFSRGWGVGGKGGETGKSVPLFNLFSRWVGSSSVEKESHDSPVTADSTGYESREPVGACVRSDLWCFHH